jgi:hypothetical protein
MDPAGRTPDQFSQAPFREAANTPKLCGAFDQLVGAGRWYPRDRLGTFPVRFPPRKPPATMVGISTSVSATTIRLHGVARQCQQQGRALLMLFLFSDVGIDDAPTRIRVGSHADIARQLAPAGEAGLTLRKFAADGFAGSAHRPEALAMGEAGTVYLCHPFLVHAVSAGRNLPKCAG